MKIELPINRIGIPIFSSKIILLSLFLAIFAHKNYAQQEPSWSSFYENGFLWNPALTAKWNFWELNVTSRQEWSGFENAPKYHTISFQYPFIKNIVRSSVGAYIDVDRIGPYESLGVGFSYTFKIYPNFFDRKDGVLTLGVSPRINQFRFNQTSLVGFDGISGENFTSAQQNNFISPNLNVGFFYNSVSDFYSFEPHFYFGASFNNVIPITNNLGPNLNWKYVPHINAHGGFRIKKSRSDYYWEPSLMISMVDYNTINVMSHIRYEKEQKYWGAFGLVSNGEVFGQIGFIFNDRSVLGWLVQDGLLRIGTKVDYSIGPIGQFSGVGYEAYVSYSFSNEAF